MHVCPYLNAPQHSACKQMPRIENLDHALTVCCGNFRSCAIFWMQVRAQRAEKAEAGAARVAADISGLSRAC